MADTSTKISGPVQVQSDSRQRVAFDLMQRIASQEAESMGAQRASRDYWLKLYAACDAAVQGNMIESILKMPR